MNAWTGADFTQYPFSTENIADFRNLRDVYWDAVFNPLLDVDDFAQEGWRWVVDEEKQLKLAGVVYNEMKGALSDADSLFLTRLQQARFGPNSVYSVVSGGDPVDIPKLSHKQLLDFHRRFYHPSNAVIVSSGRALDLKEHLSFLDGKLVDFENRSKHVSTKSLWAKDEEFSKTKRVTVSGPSDPLGDPSRQIRMLVSFVCNPVTDFQDTFNMKLLANLLFEGPSSPFYQSLIDANLGSEFAPGTGYDTSTAHTQLAVGLQGLDESLISVVEERITETFKKVRRDLDCHFTAERVETALHQIHLGLKYNSANFGLSLVSSVTQSWVHQADPLANLLIDAKVNKFKEDWQANGSVLFGRLLDKYVLSNASKLVFVMKPRVDYVASLESAEKQFIEASNMTMTEDDYTRISQDNARLKLKQEQEQDIGVLPCLQLDQIPLNIRDPSILPNRDNIWMHKTNEANGLVYFKALLDLNQLSASVSPRQLSLLPLLSSCMTEIGLSNQSAADFDAEIKRFTGGFSTGPILGRLNYLTMDAPISWQLSSYALHVNHVKMQNLLISALTRANFRNLDRLRTILTASATNSSSSIAHSGNRYAACRAASLLGFPRAERAELIGGLKQAQFLTQLLKEDDLEGLAKELEELRDMIFGVSMWRVAWTSNEEGQVDSFFKGDHGDSSNQSISPFLSSKTKADGLFIETPFNSNYLAATCLPFSALPSAHERAALTIFSRLLRTKVLHREIREKGGAYGSSAAFDVLSGLFTLSSYRDPTPQRTLQLFQSVPDFPITSQDLLEAKLATFASLDAPSDLAYRGLQQFTHGLRDEERKEFRHAVRQVTLADVSKARALISESLLRGRFCVIGTTASQKKFINFPQESLMV